MELLNSPVIVSAGLSHKMCAKKEETNFLQ